MTTALRRTRLALYKLNDGWRGLRHGSLGNLTIALGSHYMQIQANLAKFTTEAFQLDTVPSSVRQSRVYQRLATKFGRARLRMKEVIHKGVQLDKELSTILRGTPLSVH